MPKFFGLQKEKRPGHDSMYALVTCDLAQQVPMQPTMEPANVKIAEKPATMRMARKQVSITLMSSQLYTVRLRKI